MCRGTKVILLSLVVVVGVLYGYISKEHKDWLNDIKTNHTLYCTINGEYKKIDPNKIVDLIDETGTWIFTNGYARSCELY